MHDYDPKKAQGTVKERCLESKKDENGVRQCVLNAGHDVPKREKKTGGHLFPCWYDPKVIAKVNKRIEAELKREIARR